MLICGRLITIAVVLGLVTAPPVRADSNVTVGPSCSLAAAVLYADGGTEPGCAPGVATGTTTVDVPPGTYELASTLDVTAATVIDGSSGTVISGGGSMRVLQNESALEIDDVTLTDGLSPLNSGTCSGNPCGIGSPGGAIYNTGTLTLKDSVVSDSYAAIGTAPTASCDSTTGCAGPNAGAGGGGGGIYNDGTLTVVGSTITGNHAGNGGDGASAIQGTTSGSEPGGAGGQGGDGGGIYNDAAGTLTITNSTISSNGAGNGGGGGENQGTGVFYDPLGPPGDGGGGGGIYSADGLSIAGSTITANYAGSGGGIAGPGGGGGGIENGGGTARSAITDVTLTANGSGSGAPEAHLGCSGAPGAGGAIEQLSGELDLEFVTLANDRAPSECPAPAGAYGEVGVAQGASVTAAATVFDETYAYAYEACTSGVKDDGDDIEYGEADATCPGRAGDPGLDALASNGGPTQTMALGAGSAAIGAVSMVSCSETIDQRGVRRPQNGSCTAGAYQYAPPTISDLHVTLTSPTTAAVSATIDPNLSGDATTVSVLYGTASTASQSIGNGNSPVPFADQLTGLSAGTTYQTEVAATNGDGTIHSAPITITTPPSSAPKPDHGVDAAISFKTATSRRYTTLMRLVISKIPVGASVIILCHGGGCPFARRAFRPSDGSVHAGPAFARHKLKPQAKVTIEVTAPGCVGEVEVLTVRVRRRPSVTRTCLPAGRVRPTACA
jgi:hypothetical protein